MARKGEELPARQARSVPEPEHAPRRAAPALNELDSQQYGQARDQGAMRYLLKPFQLEQLERAVRTATALGMAWERLSARR